MKTVFLNNIKVILMPLFIFSSYPSSSSTITVDNYYPNEIEPIVRLACRTLTVRPIDSNLTCNIGETETTNSCPRLVIDNYIYSTSATRESPILIDTENMNVSINSEALDCVSGSTGLPPSKSKGMQINLNEGSNSGISFGVSKIYIDVDNWALVVKTIEKDVICQNRLSYSGDVLFSNSIDN